MDSSAADSLSKTVQLFQNLDMRYQVNVAGVKEQDLITQDLLHKLELESLDAVEMVKLAKQLKECRATRCMMKDEIERMQPIKDYLQDVDNVKAVRELSELIGNLRKIDKVQHNRRYYPRVL